MKILILLLVILYLGFMPIDAWKSGTPEQKEQLISMLVMKVAESQNCQAVKIIGVQKEDNIHFFGECEVADEKYSL